MTVEGCHIHPMYLMGLMLPHQPIHVGHAQSPQIWCWLKPPYGARCYWVGWETGSRLPMASRVLPQPCHMPNDSTTAVGQNGCPHASTYPFVVCHALTPEVFCLLNCQSGARCNWDRMGWDTGCPWPVECCHILPIYLPNESTLAVGHNGWHCASTSTHPCW